MNQQNNHQRIVIFQILDCLEESKAYASLSPIEAAGIFAILTKMLMDSAEKNYSAPWDFVSNNKR